MGKSDSTMALLPKITKNESNGPTPGYYHAATNQKNI